jgi:protein phosphatase
LQTGLSLIVKEALEITFDGFSKQVEEVSELLSREKGKVGNFDIMGRLVTIKPSGEALVIGDLHGDVKSLIQILQESNILPRMNKSIDTLLIFLGDYGDRGEHSAEVYYIVCKLKLLHPRQVVLMRGNHECPADLMPSPHDMPMQLQSRFGVKWKEAYAKTQKLFEHLYNALIVEERYLMIHGGLPHQAHTVKDLAYAHLLHPKQSFLEEMLWSDPDEAVEDFLPSPRGAGKLFGKSVTDKILKRYGVKILIRGHEPCEEGFKINHNGKVLTLFSRKGAPYFNAYGAYLDFKLSERLENAEQLIPHIHRF